MVDFDFIGVLEHRLIPAKVWHEWSRLRRDGDSLGPGPLRSQYIPSLLVKGAGVSLPSFAT